MGSIISGSNDVVTSIIGTILSLTQGGPKGRAPLFTQTPEPGYEKALREYTSRLLAQGAASVPPSFLDYVASGGKATLNLGNTNMTPGEALNLGLTSRGGGAVPFYQPGQSQLTPEQIMFIASQKGSQVLGSPEVKREAKQMGELSTLEGKQQTPQRQKREESLANKLSKNE